MPVAAIGVGLSIYQASQANKAAKGAQAGEEQALAQKEALAREQRDRYESLYGPMERHLISEATSDRPTEAYEKGLSDYEWGLGNIRRKLNEMPGGGLKYSGLQSLALHEAEDRSRMTMDDRQRKIDMQKGMLSFGRQSPDYFRAQEQVAGDKMGYYQRLNDIMRQNEASSWGAAARGMYSLGQSWGAQGQSWGAQGGGNAENVPMKVEDRDTLADTEHIDRPDRDYSDEPVEPQTPTE